MNVEQFYFLCKVKQIIPSFFIVISCVLSTPAKCQGFQPFADSIIYYQLLSIENESKMPLRKETFIHSMDQKAKEKNTFRWDRIMNQWTPEYRYRFIYRDAELLVEKFAIENQKNEILIARNIAQIDTNGFIVGTEMFKVDRYSGKSERQSAQKFEYKGDTITNWQLFVQGTTFLNKRSEDLYQRQKWIQIEKLFHELLGQLIERNYEYSVLNGLPIQMIIRNAKAEIIQKDSFVYKNLLLLNCFSEIFDRVDKSSASQHSAKSYFYNETGQLYAASIIRLNSKKKAMNHSGNTITTYYSNRKPNGTPGIGRSIDPSDF
ncbi:MAG: hypothetical protein IPJ31_03835 [Bacteroidetes bacterium]|nr:hypothetical protein [Bacteroidota bacterium]